MRFTSFIVACVLLTSVTLAVPLSMEHPELSKNSPLQKRGIDAVIKAGANRRVSRILTNDGLMTPEDRQILAGNRGTPEERVVFLKQLIKHKFIPEVRNKGYEADSAAVRATWKVVNGEKSNEWSPKWRKTAGEALDSATTREVEKIHANPKDLNHDGDRIQETIDYKNEEIRKMSEHPDQKVALRTRTALSLKTVAANNSMRKASTDADLINVFAAHAGGDSPHALDVFTEGYENGSNDQKTRLVNQMDVVRKILQQRSSPIKQ